jgi:methyl-accepting chemotaxis protein
MSEPSNKAIDRLMESVALSREVGERRDQALERAIDSSNQTVTRAVDEIRGSATSMAQSADRIEQQVGRMSEHLMAIDIKIERLTDEIRELTRAVNSHLKVAEKQADNISELTKLVAIQANTVATLISRTA